MATCMDMYLDMGVIMYIYPFRGPIYGAWTYVYDPYTGHGPIYKTHVRVMDLYIRPMYGAWTYIYRAYIRGMELYIRPIYGAWTYI